LGTLPFTLIGLFSISFYELLFTILLNPKLPPLAGRQLGGISISEIRAGFVIPAPC
jgi:hypothetical protein